MSRENKIWNQKLMMIRMTFGNLFDYRVKILLVIVCLFYAVTCIGQASFTYTIKGHLQGMGNDTLFLSILSGEQKPASIMVPAKNDYFSYSGTATQPSFVWAQTTGKRGANGNFTFFIEEGNIIIDGNNEDLTHTKVAGTPNNDDYNYALGIMNGYYDRRQLVQQKLRPLTDKSTAEYKKAMHEIGMLTDSVALFQNDYVATRPNSLASGILLMLIADNIPVSRLETYYNNLGDDVKQLAMLDKMPTKIAGKKRSVIGSIAPDFTMNDVNGKPVTLSKYRGKYVLLDFWASWCVPCRQDNAYLKAAYKKYKDKDFTIISVSVDENGNSWKQAVAKDQLTWTQISDLKKPNKVAELYGVQPIPDNFLNDPQGEIIERGLHGENLIKQLDILFK